VAVTNTVTGAATRFVYDGDGHRVLRIGPAGTTVYLGDIYEENVTTGVATAYYDAGGRRVAMRVGGVIYYLHGDHLGSTSLATTAGGAIVPGSRTGYDPYGAVRYGGALPTDFTFTGQRVEGFGLYDYRARWYDPALGRFVSADTVVPEPGNPQALNRYAYVTNNPLRYTDPSGHYIFEGEYCVGPGCDYNPTSPYYQLPLMGGTINPNTYFLSPAVSQEIFGVAEAQRVAVGTVVAVNDPNNVGMVYVALLGALTGWVTAQPVPQVATQTYVPSSLRLDASGDPDCPGCGFRAAWSTAVTRGGIEPVRIGQAGEEYVADLLEHTGEPILRRHAYFRTPEGGRAFIDFETEHFLIEVKNLANPSMSPTFREQVRAYWQISQQIGRPLRYYFTNQPPSPGMIVLFRELRIEWFHVPMP